MTQIFDINSYSPIKDERYFVDTNVWFWTSYVGSKSMPRSKQPDPYQLASYPRFLERAVSDGAILCHSALTFSELANLIENTELDLYKQKVGNQYLDKKTFRRIPGERKSVLTEINVAWNTVSSMSQCLQTKLDNQFVMKSYATLCEGVVDPFDAFFIQTMKANSIDYVITDDHDYCSITNHMIVTANSTALKYIS